jgi:hypothetical protein
MPEPILDNIKQLPNRVVGVGMGIRMTIPVTAYELQHVVFYLEREDDTNLSYTADSTGDYVQIIPADGGEPNEIQISIPSTQLTALAVAGKRGAYAIELKATAEADPDYRLQGILIWNRRPGAIDE